MSVVTLVGYQILEPIYLGTRTLVYRGIRELDNKLVVIKLLRDSYPCFSDVVQFRNQYTSHPPSLPPFARGDRGGWGWQCNIVGVKALALTDDVVEFMALQLQKLPEATQFVLRLAACIGNQFNLAMLSIVHEKSQIETADALWKALQDGLILPVTEVYKFYQDQTANSQLAINNEQLAQYRFLHDRVQQAAYSLIPSEQKQATHLKIGKLLLSSLSKIERDEKIFDIVNQLDIGAELIIDPGERKQLTQLNLDAGCKALLSTAYTAAVEYFTVGRNLLATDSWKQQYKLTLVQANQKKMKKWAHHAPLNYLHRLYLVEAERYRVLGKNMEALEYYDRAIALAKENEYLNEEALANELAAKFYIQWGKQRIAQDYLTDAYYCYTRWGAKAKVDDLEKRYPELLAPILQREQSNNFTGTITNSISKSYFQTLASSGTSILNSLDFSSILKATQTLSSEIQLDKLLSTVMQVVMENAGGKKGALILPKGDIWAIKAVATVGLAPTILQSIPLESTQELPISPINYVKNTKKLLVIDDATNETSFASDPYIIAKQPKSLLITPILNQGQFIGILY